MRSYDISSSKFSPALLDKKKKKSYLLLNSIWPHQKTHTQENDFCCLEEIFLKSHRSVVKKKKKVLLVNQLKNKHEYSFVTHLKP